VSVVEVNDSERDRVVRELTRFCGDGRLTLDELEERVAEVYAATTTAEIQHALRQLPAVQTFDSNRPVDHAAPTPPRAAAMPHAHASAAVERARDRNDLRAGEIALRVHMVVFLSVVGLLTAIWFLTSPFGYFWPIWVAMPWGMALAIHAGVHRAVWHNHER
jgi:hypothetical protein